MRNMIMSMPSYVLVKLNRIDAGRPRQHKPLARRRGRGEREGGVYLFTFGRGEGSNLGRRLL
jgi:hypothetical protein